MNLVEKLILLPLSLARIVLSPQAALQIVVVYNLRDLLRSHPVCHGLQRIEGVQELPPLTYFVCTPLQSLPPIAR
jgi:hypothetical protein